jgi:LEA14-like dessication related protein
MKKILLVFIVAAMVVINGTVGALLFLDIQLMKWPETTIKIDLIEINSEEAVVYNSIEIYNPNSFDLTIGDLEVITCTIDGNEIAYLQIDGGEIPPRNNRTFISTDRIRVKGNEIDILKSKITGTIGGRFLGVIQKTLPFEINVVTSFEKPLKDISLPLFTVSAEFGEITRDEIEFKVKITVDNKNTFDIYVSNFTLEIENETRNNVGKFNVAGGKIASGDTTVFEGHGVVLIKALNAKKLLIKLNGEAGAQIAGMNRSIPFSSETEISIPNLEELIPSDKPLDLRVAADSRLTAKGFVIDFTLEVKNPTKIAFIIQDIVAEYYRVDDDKETLLTSTLIEGGEILAGETRYFYGHKMIPFSAMKISKEGLKPDWHFLRLKANFSIPGVNKSIWASVGVYLDRYPLLRT